jgi:hypothetical protein
LTGERRSSFLASPQSRNHAPFCTVSNDRT